MIGIRLLQSHIDIIQLPLRYGGLGISLPDTRPELNLKYSIRLCSILSENIPVTQIKAKQQEKALEISKERDIDFQKQAYALKFHNEEANQKMLYASIKGASTWLSVRAFEHRHHALSKNEFHD
ncbi:hypothetical protein GJ496_006295, partial [Pomphorhynchus laevis]